MGPHNNLKQRQQRSPESSSHSSSYGPGSLQDTTKQTPYEIREEKISSKSFPTRSPILAAFAHGAVCLSWLVYLTLRFQTCLEIHRWNLWLLLICEFIFATPELFQIMELSLWFTPGRKPAPRPLYRLIGNDAPSVHIFITMCGEDLDVIMDTITAAAIQDYPRHCYRIFVLDDANDSRVKIEIDNFNQSVGKRLAIQPVVYLTRPKKSGIQHHYKAGNLDFGIRASRDQYGSSEFIAGLDADMIPEADWLQRIVPHLVYGPPDLALVSPPQYFYNVSDHDILAEDANVLQQVLEPVRDHVGCSMCHGSGYVMRQEALESIHGWPLVNIGEDILCSYLLNRAGWQTAFIKDKLTFGLIPESFHAYVSQRMRWTAGNLLSARKFHFFLPFLDRSNITNVQKFHGWMQSVKTLAWVALIVPILVLPVNFSLLGTGELSGTSFGNRKIVWHAYIVAWTVSKLWKRIFFSHVGSANVLNLANNRLWITPYIVRSFYQSLWLDLAETEFEISGTFESPIDERSDRSQLWQRMTDPLVLIHSLYLAVASAGFSALIVGLLRGNIFLGQSHTYFHAGATVCFFQIVWAASVPVRYMLAPPGSVDRRRSLAKEESGAFRAAKKTWSKRSDNCALVKDVLELALIVVYGCV